MPEKPKTRDYILSDKQINIILTKLEDSKEILLFYGLLYTGMRISEFLHLKKSWIDFNERFIIIPQSEKCECGDCKKNKKGIWKTKTKESAREIYIVDEVIDLFKSYFENHKKINELIQNRIIAWKIIKNIGKKSGITLFPHCIRGTFATILASKGFNEFEICGAMGWVDIKRAKEYIKLSGKRVTDVFKKKWRSI